MLTQTELPNTTICISCHDIDWSPLLDIPTQQLAETGHFLRSLGRCRDQGKADAHCLLCSPLRSIAPKLAQNYKLQVRLYGVDESGFAWDEACKISARKLKERSIAKLRAQLPVIAAVRDRANGTYKRWNMGEIGERGFLVGDPDSDSHAVQAIEKNVVRYDVIKAFLDQARNSNDLEISGALILSDRSTEIYVIDVDTMDIMPLPNDESFVALSYVWGKQSLAKDVAKRSRREFREGFSLQNECLPLTIQDAVRATKMLGRRYLWVDRYCINLTDHAHQAEMIGSMDKIYAGAEFTIVALSGQHADAGLPGISSVSRHQQASFTAGNVLWRSTLPGLKALLRDSLWSTRGWTYQEARLSRVCLFFTDHQVYCVSKSDSISESLPALSGTYTLNSFFPGTILNGDLLSTSVKVKTHFEDRFAYSQRALSYESDALNAYAGLLNQQEFLHISGQPVAGTNCNLAGCAGFAMGLLWVAATETYIQGTEIVAYKRLRRPSTRRINFPSWSWSSLDAGIVSHPTYSSGQRDPDGLCQKFMENKQINNSPPLCTHFSLPSAQGMENIDICDAHRLFTDKGTKNLNFDKLIVAGDVVKIRFVKRRLYEHSASFMTCNEEGKLILHQEDILHATTAYGMKPSDDTSIDMVDDYNQQDYRSIEPDDIAPRDWTDTDEANYLATGSVHSWKVSDKIYDALVLIDWSTDTGLGSARWVLMLLEWLDDETATRAGILGCYAGLQPRSKVDSIPRRRMRFTLA